MYRFSNQADQTLYDSIVENHYKTENKITVGGTDYDNSSYVSASIIGTLMDKVSIGNVCARSAEITFRGVPEFASGANVQIYQRVKNTTGISAWAPKGEYNIYRRYKNSSNTRLRVMCYDALYKTDTPFMKSGTWESVSALNLVLEICELLDISLNVATRTLLSTDSTSVDFIPSIGAAGTTIREMLSYIAITYAGNWKINDSGELELVELNPATVDTLDIQDNVQKFELSPEFPAIDRVQLTNGDSVFYAPNVSDEQWEAMTGYILSVETPYATQELATRILNKVSGYIYRPYTATKAYAGILLGLGDVITVDNITFPVCKQTISLSNSSPSTLSAINTGSEEADEIGYSTPEVRAIKRNTVQQEANFSVLDGKITLETSKRAEEDSKLTTRLEETAEGLLVTFTKGVADAEDKAQKDLTAYSEVVQQYIRFAQGIIELGEQNSAFKAILSNVKLSFTGENGQEVAWISNNQLFISEAVVNGRLTLQDITKVHKWVTIVNSSDGHLSGQYVHA